MTDKQVNKKKFSNCLELNLKENFCIISANIVERIYCLS